MKFRLVLLLMSATVMLLLIVSCRSVSHSNHQLNSDLDQEFSQRDQGKLNSLFSHCIECHSGGRTDGGFGLAASMLELANRKDYVQKGNPTESYLWQRVVGDKDMPPDSARSKPTESERAALTKWISAGAPVNVISRKLVSNAQAFAAIRRDLNATSLNDRPFIRYISLINLHNHQIDGFPVIQDDQLAGYRNGISMLLNSLHWNREITPVEIVPGTEKAMLRLDLRNYSSTPQQIRQLGLSGLLNGGDVFNYAVEGIGVTPAAWNKMSSDDPYRIFFAQADYQEIHKMVSTPDVVVKFPIMRADFFTFIAARSHKPREDASKNFMYYRILGIPNNLSTLEKGLFSGLDVNGRLRARKPITRSGFVDSGVSDHNRLLERHPIAAYPGANGAAPSYWLSYDFDSSSDRKDFNRNPIGPISVFGNQADVFDHDGGEVIFSLPNGLHAFALTNDKSEIIAEGPTNIVRDLNRGTIYNGFSCMDCHSGGMIPKSDRVFDSLQSKISAGLFEKSDQDILNYLYSGIPSKLSNEFENETKSFLSSKAKAMIGGDSLTEKNLKGVSDLYDRFVTEVTPETAASELDISLERLEKLLSKNKNLNAVLSSFNNETGRMVKRETFRNFFPRIVKELRLADEDTKEDDILSQGELAVCTFQIVHKDRGPVAIGVSSLTATSDRSLASARTQASQLCENRLSPGIRQGGYHCEERLCEVSANRKVTK